MLYGRVPQLTAQFNHRQLSRPATLAEASSRVSYNMRNFSGNYLVIVIILAVYAL